MCSMLISTGVIDFHSDIKLRCSSPRNSIALLGKWFYDTGLTLIHLVCFKAVSVSANHHITVHINESIFDTLQKVDRWE